MHFVAHLAGLHLAAVLDEAQREARPGTRRARADAAPEADSGVGVGFLASPRPDSTRLSNTPAFSHVESDTQAIRFILFGTTDPCSCRGVEQQRERVARVLGVHLLPRLAFALRQDGNGLSLSC